jgi:hypothetical protein
MGVMLSLDRPGLARNRRQARHARRPDEQAWADVLAAIVRDEPPRAGCLVRLAKNVLAGLLIPADSSPADSPAERPLGADHEPGQHADRARGGRAVRTGRGLSGACLLGQCQDSPGGPACASATCRHDCHGQVTAPGQVAAPGQAAAGAVRSVA